MATIGMRWICSVMCFSIIYAVSSQCYPVDTPSIMVACLFSWSYRHACMHANCTHASSEAKCWMHMHNSFQWCNKLERTHFVWIETFRFVPFRFPFNVVKMAFFRSFFLSFDKTIFQHFCHNHKYINVVYLALKGKR